MPINRETSVFNIDELSETEIWDIGDREVTRPGRAVLARGDILSRHVYANDLEIDLDDDPPRHANITAWPSDQPDNSKQKLIAIALAEKAELFIK